MTVPNRFNQHAATPNFNIVWMCTYCQNIHTYN
jgi:hypothetical protein